MQSSVSMSATPSLVRGEPPVLLMARPLQESNPFHFEDSQVVLEVIHKIASYVPILLNLSLRTGRGEKVQNSSLLPD